MTTATTARAAKSTSSREAWLNAFVTAARPVFAARGFVIPDKVRVAIGFTSAGARSKAIGECWTSDASADGTFEIFIVPGMDDAARIAGILTHELGHAVAGIPAGHGAAFAKVARGMGLEGKLTATTEGPEWDAWARPILKRLGDLPHAKLSGVSSAKPKQTTRMLKAECNVCGFTVRGTKSWLCIETPDGAVVAKRLRCPDASFAAPCEGQLMVDLPDLGEGDEVGEE